MSVVRHEFTLTIDVSANTTTIAATKTLFGHRLLGLIVKAPTLDGAATFTLTVRDTNPANTIGDDVTVWGPNAFSAKGGNATYICWVNSCTSTPAIDDALPFDKNFGLNFQIVASGAQSSDKEFIIVAFVES